MSQYAGYTMMSHTYHVFSLFMKIDETKTVTLNALNFWKFT